MLRTRAEDLKPCFTRPNKSRHRCSTGGTVDILAGSSASRVVLWEEIRGRWNGETASAMYRGPIAKFLKKKYGEKDRFLIVEDNDPTGYKSRKGMAAKAAEKIRTVPWPRYSPDLMPLDFSLWANINNRMSACSPKGKETVASFKARLRRVAFGTPQAAVRDMVAKIRAKAREIYEAAGKDMSSD